MSPDCCQAPRFAFACNEELVLFAEAIPSLAVLHPHAPSTRHSLCKQHHKLRLASISWRVRVMRCSRCMAGVDWKMSPSWGQASWSCEQPWALGKMMGLGLERFWGHSGASQQGVVGRRPPCLHGGWLQAGECGLICRLRVPLLLVCCLSLLPVLLPALGLQPGSCSAQFKAWGHLSSQLTLVLPAPQPGAQGRIWR